MQKGFTIIELLIVIVIIGILVGIGIASYSGFQKRAYDAAVQSDLESIAGELESYRNRNPTTNPNQRFPLNTTDLGNLEAQASKSNYDTTISYNMIYCVGPNSADPNVANQNFRLVARSKSGSIFVMTQDGFASNSYTSSNMTSSFCSTTDTPTQVNGMTSGGTWASWVRSS